MNDVSHISKNTLDDCFTYSLSHMRSSLPIRFHQNLPWKTDNTTILAKIRFAAIVYNNHSYIIGNAQSMYTATTFDGAQSVATPGNSRLIRKLYAHK